MASFVPPGPRRRHRLEELFWAMLRSGPVQAGTVDVAVDARGEVVGTAVWEAPRTGRESPWPTVAQLPGYLRALGIRGAVAALRHRTALQRPRPTLPHWYLAEIGVSTTARGLGVGTSLLEHRLRQIDAAGDAAYLESSTERNRALYRRHGFVELGPITGLPSAEPIAMWRPRDASGGASITT
jgi:ribosomal protein S18 acetylase RimI-like enzyme